MANRKAVMPEIIRGMIFHQSVEILRSEISEAKRLRKNQTEIFRYRPVRLTKFFGSFFQERTGGRGVAPVGCAATPHVN